MSYKSFSWTRNVESFYKSFSWTSQLYIHQEQWIFLARLKLVDIFISLKINKKKWVNYKNQDENKAIVPVAGGVKGTWGVGYGAKGTGIVNLINKSRTQISTSSSQ